jgi:hypothetical protein
MPTVKPFPAPQLHAPIEEIFPDVFLIRGSFRVAPLMRISRNMIVLREGSSLTLVNSVRLSPEGEAQLDALGTVKHLVKLGHYHTLDDPYYRDRYALTYWAPAPTASDPSAKKLVDGARGPDARSLIFSFQNTSQGEAALIVEQSQGNLLVTCDSVQHWADTTSCSWLGGVVAKQMGFFSHRAKIGPIWVKELSGGKPATLWPDFQRLLAHDFAHLVSGHGGLLRDDAKASLALAVDAIVKPR